MPTQVQGLGLVDDQGNKSIVVNLSNARQMTNSEYQQLSQDERAGAIIVTDYPIPEESDEVSVTADGNTSWRELLNELYTKIDFSKINENTVFYRSDDNFWFALTRREGNNTLHFGGAMNYGTYMRTFGFELTSSASYFIRCDSQDSGNTNTNQSSNNPGSGTILKVIYNYYKNQDIHTEYLASKCMMQDGSSVEEAIGAINGVNSATFSGNTDANGNCIISSSRSVLNARLEASGNYTSYVFYYAPTATWYIHVMDVSGNKQSGVPVYGTYYYID